MNSKNAKRSKGKGARRGPRTRIMPATLQSRTGPTVTTRRSNVTNIQNVEVFSVNPAASTIHNYVVNPGNTPMFPWLASIAKSFEFYKFRKLAVHWVTAEPSTAGGSATMCFDLDVDDPAPSSITAIMINSGAVSGAVRTPLTLQALPSQYAQHPVPLYTSAAAVSPTRTSDWGRFYAYLTAPAATAMGRFVVEYDVDLMGPQEPMGDVGIHLTNPSPTPANIVSVASGATIDADSSRHWEFSDAGDRLVCRKPGFYLLTTKVTDTTASITADNTLVHGTDIVSTKVDHTTNATSSTVNFLIQALKGADLYAAAVATALTSASINIGSWRAKVDL